MIIQRLRGGLGNQLFQFAAGKALALAKNTDFKLDLYYYKRHAYRTFDLENFNVPIEIASRKEVHQFTGSNPFTRLYNKLENYFHCAHVFVQPHYHYYPHFLKLPDNLYLSGYWQSEKYFDSIKEDIIKWFTPKEPLDEINQEVVADMQSFNSVSLHVRLGDYVNANSTGFFKVLDTSYYQKAIEFVQSRVQDPKFYIFSEDIAWCRNHLQLPENSTFIDHNRGTSSYKDLVLMSSCKHNIIANSTFSWWAAWLNKNENKIVVAPSEWFNSDYMTKKTPVYPTRLYVTSDLYPENWHIL